MESFLANAKIVSDTLVKYHYGDKCIRTRNNCLTLLYEDTNRNGMTAFSLDYALSWCERKVKGDTLVQYRNAILQIADVYKFGRVTGANLRVFPSLSQYYSSIIDLYISHLRAEEIYSKRSIKIIRWACTEVCCYLLYNEIETFEEASYSVFSHYNQFLSEGDCEYRKKVHNVVEFLHFLSKKGIARPGFYLFMDYAADSKCLLLEEIPTEAQQRFESAANEKGLLSASEMYAVIPDFLSGMRTKGYSDKVISTSSYRLSLLYLFLDMNGLKYNDRIVFEWLQYAGKVYFGSKSVDQARRTFDMFKDYVVQGSLITTNHRTRRVAGFFLLPIWCQKELDLYFDVLQKEGRAENTISGIRSICTRFCNFLIAQEITRFEDVTPATIKQFNVTDIHGTMYGKNQCNGRLRDFLIFLELKHVVPLGIHFALPHSYSGGEKIVKILSPEDQNGLVKYCQAAISPVQIRDAAIITVALTTPFRACDIVGLKKSNLDFKRKVFRFMQDKTDVEQTFPMENPTGNAIFRYLRDIRPKDIDNDYVFVGVRAPFNPLPTSACNDALSRAGISTTEFHSTRRTYATSSLRGGATYEEVAELLGQSDNSTVHRYVSLDEDRMMQCPLSITDTNLGISGRYTQNGNV